MDKILYFPTISIPNDQWLMTSLFYWDKIGSIVPLDFLEEPERLEVHTRKLVEAELVEQIIPEIYTGKVRGFEEQFLNFIDYNLIPNKKDKNLNKQINITDNGMATKQIHMGKLRGIGDELERRGLVSQNNGPWYSIESETASYFMTYLATVLGQMTDFTPMTNNYDDMTRFIANHEVTSSRQVIKETLRAQIINDILPIPNYVEDLYDIARFKERHYAELKRFRRRVESFILNLEVCPEVRIDEQIRNFKEASQEEIESILSNMKYFQLKNLGFADFCVVGTAALNGARAIIEGNEIDKASSVLSILGAVAILRDKNQVLEAKKQPLAYAAIMEKKFGGR